ncbi:Uncharacterised protein [Mycobacteroides abscessus subsp. abscessus]|nr:Uncharacterised protein [Mycobacteroides abscessus subsp. abscessus]
MLTSIAVVPPLRALRVAVAPCDVRGAAPDTNGHLWSAVVVAVEIGVFQIRPKPLRQITDQTRPVIVLVVGTQIRFMVEAPEENTVSGREDDRPLVASPVLVLHKIVTGTPIRLVDSADIVPGESSALDQGVEQRDYATSSAQLRGIRKLPGELHNTGAALRLVRRFGGRACGDSLARQGNCTCHKPPAPTDHHGHTCSLAAFRQTASTPGQPPTGECG